jgi:protein arginine N-methyltransferase 2
MVKMIDYELIFTDNSIYRDRGNGTLEHVMMDWEHPIMEKHAKLMSYPGADVLEIGFGMGISANYIQQNKPNSHTIVEIHPRIIERAREWAKDKVGVRIIEGDWIDVVDKILEKPYNGIFFDSHADGNKKSFRELVVDKAIKPGGVFTYFNMEGRDTYGYGDMLKKSHGRGDIKVPEGCEYHQFNAYCIPYVVYPGPL